MASKIDKFCNLFRSIEFKIKSEPEKKPLTKEELEHQKVDKILEELQRALSKVKIEFNEAKKMYKQGKLSESELFDFELRVMELKEEIERIKNNPTNALNLEDEI